MDPSLIRILNSLGELGKLSVGEENLWDLYLDASRDLVPAETETITQNTIVTQHPNFPIFMPIKYKLILKILQLRKP